MRYSAPKLRASSSKTLMNSSPMIFRFSSGSTTSSSLPRNLSLASTTTRLRPLSFKAASTSADSFALMRPWSTWTAIRFPPRAFPANAAATLESMPPLRAMMAFPSPTASLIARIASSTLSRGLQLASQPQTLKT